MSECEIVIQKFVENPESIQDATVQNHLDNCPKCKDLFSVLTNATSENMPELVDELSQQERSEILDEIRSQGQLLFKRDLTRKKMFFFKPKFSWALAGAIIIMASWLSLHHFLPGGKENTQISQERPVSRKMTLLIQSDSKPRLYLEIEYFPENKSQGGI